MNFTFDFNFEQTADGSPTLRIGQAPELSEAMHSLRGAFSETVYIYGTAIETCITRGFPKRVLSLGLGLGYVELLATALFLKHDAREDFQGRSFEIVPELRLWFQAWLEGSGEVPNDFREKYDEILARTGAQTAVDMSEIRASLAMRVRDGRWQISAELSPQTRFESKFGCICFDAFSSKTSPELWSEEFLGEFLDAAADQTCVLSTYACTGRLKRSLVAKGFQLQIREGYSSKRDSTFAVRS